MQSIIQHMNTEMINVKKLLNNLMDCSDIVRWNYSKIIMSGAGDYQWEKLNENGRKIQERLLIDYNRFITLIRFLTKDLPTAEQSVVETSAQKVYSIIKQTGVLFRMSKEEQLTSSMKAIDQQFDLIVSAYEVTDDYRLIIPDSSALIANPELDKWKFEEIGRFKIMLLPTVVDELDKADASNDPARNKHIKKIVEYAKLGNILEGIKIIKLDDSMQKIEKTLPWLDLTNNYDIIIAAYFEIVRANPHSQVVLVTNTPSLQKKALSSNVAHINPPLLPIDNKPVKSVPPDTKLAVEAANSAPAVNKPAKAMPPPRSQPDNKPTKVMIPPNMINQPPSIRPAVPKSIPLTEIKPSDIRQKDARPKARKPKR